MKKIKKISICLLLLTSLSSIGQIITSGVIRYTISSDNEQLAMMGDVILTNYFDNENVAIEVDMMGGMVLTKIYKKIYDPKSSKMTMSAMENNFEITDIDENATKSIDIADLDNITNVILDKTTAKEILGFKCYKAIVNYEEDKTGEFYITDAIKMTTSTKESKLKGVPLEMKIITPEATVQILATEFLKEIPTEAFIVPEGFEKITMKEFQERMGG